MPMRAQLLERETQLATLDQIRSEIGASGGRIALVYGEAGIGKTSLVERFLESAGAEARTLRGACDPFLTARPLGPLHDMAIHTGGKLEELLRAGSDRFAIYGAFLAELGRGPTLALVEDVHWADEATLDLLRFVARRIRQTSALLILTYRDDELGQNHPLRQILGDQSTAPNMVRVPVPALSEHAVDLLAGDPSLDTTRLHRLSNGNPFFITEVLAAHGAISETILDAVMARAGRLSPPARHILEVAAVIGPRIEPGLLLRLSDSDEASVEECVSTGMLVAHGSIFAFRHELARQSVLASLLPSTRLALHRKALEALMLAPEAERDPVLMTRHAAGAEESGLVLQYAPLAARQASQVSAHREAIGLLELALPFADSLPPAQRAAMLDQCSVELGFTGRFEDCVPVLRQAAELWHAAGEPLRQGDSLHNLGIVLFPLGWSQEAEEAEAAAVELLEALPESPELGRAYKGMCFLCLERREPAPAVEWGKQSAALAERFQDWDTLARAYNYAGSAAMPMDYDLGRELLERSLEVGLKANMPFAVGGALTNACMVLTELFLFSEADGFLQRGLAYATEHDDDYHLTSLLGIQGQMLFHKGAWKDARALMTRVAEGPVRDPGIPAMYRLARLGVREGRKSASEELARVIAEYGQMDLVLPMGPMHAGTAEQAWLAGDNERAAREARWSYEAASGKHLPWFTGELAFWRWRAGDAFPVPDWIAEPYAAQISGDWQRAARAWEELECPYEQGMALMDGDSAARLEALRIFENLGANPIAQKLRQQLRAEGVRGIPRGARPSTRKNAFGLTARELEVLAALRGGASNSAIAGQLSLSTRTVEHHIASILRKAGVGSRGEAIAFAQHEDLFDPD